VLFFTTALWGIFWLPLRKIEANGIPGIWAVIGIYLVPLTIMLPLVVYRRKSLLQHKRAVTIAGMAIGLGLCFYAVALLHTSIIRTILLFYMTPIWATLLAWLILKEKPNTTRWFAIGIGLAGVVLILSTKSSTGTTTALNIGDLLALLAGFSWGYGTVALKQNPHVPAIDVVPSQYLWACIAAVFAALMLPGTATAPSAEQWINALPIIVGFFVLLLLPSIYICTRISQILSPGRVGILMMSEVLVAVISASLLTGETILPMEWIAGTLIVLATVVEVTPLNIAKQ